MLVLARKHLEAVVVGASDRFEHLLKVTVLEIKSGCVRLGFEIDASVPVHRLEVWERIHALGRPLPVVALTGVGQPPTSTAASTKPAP